MMMNQSLLLNEEHPQMTENIKLLLKQNLGSMSK